MQCIKVYFLFSPNVVACSEVKATLISGFIEETNTDFRRPSYINMMQGHVVHYGKVCFLLYYFKLIFVRNYYSIW